MLDATYQWVHPDDRQSWILAVCRGPFRFAWHFHPEYEIVIIVSGAGTCFVGDTVTEFGTGDLIITGPDLPHTYVSDAYAEAVCCQFDSELFGAAWTKRPEFRLIDNLFSRAARGVQFTGVGVEPWLQMVRASPAQRTAALLAELVGVAESGQGEPLSSAGYQPRVDQDAMGRISSMVSYIDCHLNEPISVASVAKVAYLSEDAAGRFFRRQTGQTIPEYVNRARIAAACRALLARDTPVSRIASDCGYANLANFHRQFRRITGATPAGFRRQGRITPAGTGAEPAAVEPLHSSV